jgi:VanZ family protein
MSKTAAWPLALVYALLIAYASLYPFDNWRYQGSDLLAFVVAPLPKYWTWFDVALNILGYVPMGFLVTWTVLRKHNKLWTIGWGGLVTLLLSLAMEVTQGLLPSRISSNLDLLLNAGGGLMGSCMAYVAAKVGLFGLWASVKRNWFVGEPRGALVLLALWPLALIFPAALPFGLGQVAERLMYSLNKLFLDTPLALWLPQLTVEPQALSPATEWACITLGLLFPSLLAYSVMQDLFKRWLVMLSLVAVGLSMTAASSILTFGPDHAWEWVTPAAKAAVIAAVILATALLFLPRRAALVLLFTLLIFQLGWLNNAPTSSYLTQTLSTWEQGRFARFNGLAQWMGWLWPYFLGGYTALVLAKREPGFNKPAGA